MTEKFTIKSAKTVFDVYAANESEPKSVFDGSLGIVWRIECAKDKGAGEITGPAQGWLQVTFESCKGTPELGGAPVACTSAAGKGKIATEQLKTALWSSERGGAGERTEVEVGGETDPSPLVTRFACGAATFEVHGGLGAPEVAEPALNTCSKNMALRFEVSTEAGKEGIPIPWGHGAEPVTEQSLAESPFPFTALNGSPIGGAGLEGTETLKAKHEFCVFNEFPKQ